MELKMKQLLLFLWQLPQNLLGWLLVLCYKPERVHKLNNGMRIYYSLKMTGGISLGDYCIVHTGNYRKNVEDSLQRNIVKHEAIGHGKQSRMLGWLYLLIIGLPSIIWAVLFQYNMIPDHLNYYWFYTEKWADKLAGIKRNL